MPSGTLMIEHRVFLPQVDWWRRQGISPAFYLAAKRLNYPGVGEIWSVLREGAGNWRSCSGKKEQSALWFFFVLSISIYFLLLWNINRRKEKGIFSWGNFHSMYVTSTILKINGEKQHKGRPAPGNHIGCFRWAFYMAT